MLSRGVGGVVVSTTTATTGLSLQLFVAVFVVALSWSNVVTEGKTFMQETFQTKRDISLLFCLLLLAQCLKPPLS